MKFSHGNRQLMNFDDKLTFTACIEQMDTAVYYKSFITDGETFSLCLLFVLFFTQIVLTVVIVCSELYHTSST